jgi:hypothetical protein
VKEHGGASNLVAQANQRLTNLDRLAQFRNAEGDSVEKKAEAGFLLAELYLFQLEKPERALEEYGKIVTEFAGTPIAAKAMNAQAWVLSRRLERPAEADSLFWAVVRQHPATEAQLAARDYLEMEGIDVPAELIKLPERQLAREEPPPVIPPPSQNIPLFQTEPHRAGIDSTSRPAPNLPPGVGDSLFLASPTQAPPSPAQVGPPEPAASQTPPSATSPPPSGSGPAAPAGPPKPPSNPPPGVPPNTPPAASQAPAPKDSTATQVRAPAPPDTARVEK